MMLAASSMSAAADHSVVLATCKHFDKDQNDAECISDHDEITKIHHCTPTLFGSLPVLRELQGDSAARGIGFKRAWTVLAVAYNWRPHDIARFILLSII